MTAQKERDRQAQGVVKRLHDQKATPEQALDVLNTTCSDPDHLDFAPHLVTAMREAGWWPNLQRASIL